MSKGLLPVIQGIERSTMSEDYCFRLGAACHYSMFRPIPVITHCRDCVSFESAVYGDHDITCADPLGLKAPKQDGSDYCPYGKRK